MIFKNLFGRKNTDIHKQYLTRMRATIYKFAEEKCKSPVWDKLVDEIMAVEEKRIDQVIKLLKEKNIPVEAYIKQIVYNVCSNRAESGRYHIYRGMLNPEGEEYWKITKRILSDLVEDGVFKEEWAHEQLSIIEENIRSVG